MSAANSAFSHVVLWMSASAWPLQSQIVAADTVKQAGERLTLLRDGQPVFQARVGDVAQLEQHTSLHLAQRAFGERRAIRGRGGLRIDELAPSPGPTGTSSTVARGGPAEGIGFRVSEDR